MDQEEISDGSDIEFVDKITDEEEVNDLKTPNSKKARLDGETVIIESNAVKPIILLETEENSDDLIIENLTAQDIFNILLTKCKLVIFSYQNLNEINSNERNLVSTTLIQHFLNKNPSQK